MFRKISAMAQETYAKLEEETSSPPRRRCRCRCSTTYVQITCQVLGAIVLIVCVVSIERRLAILEHTIDSMTSKGVRNDQSRHSMQFGGHGASQTKTNTSNERSQATHSRSFQKRSLFHLPGKLNPKGYVLVRSKSGRKRPSDLGLRLAQEWKNQNQLPELIYKRWGRKDCPETATLVYHGYLVDSPSGSHFACHSKGSTHDLNSEQSVALQRVQNTIEKNQLPCSACHATLRRSQMMIRGWKVCPSGWTVEYRGYLLSPHKVNAAQRKQVICVDEKAEKDATNSSTGAGATLVRLGRFCKSFPCKKPYRRHLLPCAVCTK